MKSPKYLFFIVFFSLPIACIAQDYNLFHQNIEMLYQAKSPEDIDTRWEAFTKKVSIPYLCEDSAAFFYRGKAESVTWMGDFNGWGYDKSFMNKGTQIPHTDIWILKAAFPKDARMDYKIVVDEKTWMLDLLNPNQQWSGVGGGSPNSELCMPYWKKDPITISDVSQPHGHLEKDILINSKNLGYQITYSVYLPVGYTASQRYPVVYALDGYEYMHERMGNMTTVLDNLINQHKIQPIIVIFMDHREPVNRSNNRRMMELAMNEKYLMFFTDELIPVVEHQYPILKDRASRAILGTSMGGLTAAYFSFSKPEIFGLAGIQSPAFWFKPDIYTFCDNPKNPPLKIFMTTGIINDAQEGSRKMKTILEKNTCTYQYLEVSQGHSWGNWRDCIDDILIYFFPVK